MKKILSILLAICLLLAPVANASAAILKYNGGTYSGVVKNDKMNGYGTYTDKNGTTYIGAFMNNVIKGKGTMISSGNKYVGNFVNGKLSGKVNIYMKEGYIIKNEPFKNGEQVNMVESEGTVDLTAVDELHYMYSHAFELSPDEIDAGINYILSLNSQYYLAYILKADLYSETVVLAEDAATDEAEKILEAVNAAIKIDPNKPEAYYYKALVYHHAFKNYDKAVEYFKMCADRLDKRDEDAYTIINPYDYIEGDYNWDDSSKDYVPYNPNSDVQG